MNGQEQTILQLWNERMTPENIALKLGVKINEVLSILYPKVIGYADDAREKQRFAIMEGLKQ